jgi:hypothetical protein
MACGSHFKGSMNSIKFLFFSLVFFSLSGCSNHTREANAGIDYDTMMSNLNSFIGGSTTANGSSSSGSISVQSQNGNTTDFASLVQSGTNIKVYFAEAPGSLGPVVSVASFSDFGFVGRSDLDYSQISDIQIFFVDGTLNEQRTFGLLIAIRAASQAEGATSTGYETYAFTGTSPDISGGQLGISISGNNGNSYYARTNDVDKNGNLDDVIQIKISDGESDQDIGQFSTLVNLQ